MVTRYEPALIFSDGEWDLPSAEWRSPELLAWLFNESKVKDEVVINDRWGKDSRHQHGGYWTTEYTPGMRAGDHPWEESRGMGFSYGYNRAERLEHYRTGRELLTILVVIVSRGGNLLLDIGPDADGTIPVIMEPRLAEIGAWLEVNGDAIYGTRPFPVSKQWSAGEIPAIDYNKEYDSAYDVSKLTGPQPAGKVHTWGAKSFHNHLTLHRLSNKESLEMATHLLGTKEIEKVLEDLILEKTEGVPFFIEEFIKSLKDLKIIEREDNRFRLSKDVHHLTIPSTIQDVIMARVDSLPEGAKEVLQTGSVIEREFSYPLINSVIGLPENELLSHLSALKNSELLYERGIYPQSTYVFKHALTREVVYDSILAKRKKKLHDEIGNAIEELTGSS